MKIRSYLALMAIAVLLPLVVFSGIIFTQLLGAEREAELRAMQESARGTSLVVDAQWTQASSIVDALAQSPYLHSRQFAAFQKQAKSTLRTGSFYIVVFDEQGQQRVNTSLAPDAPMPSTTEVDRQRVMQVLQGGRAVISLVPGRGAENQVVTQESPVTLASGQRYVIAYGFDARELRRAMPNESVSADARFTILDREGVSVARSIVPDQFVKLAGAVPARSGDLIDAAPAAQSDAAQTVSADLVQAVRSQSEDILSGRSVDGMRTYTALARSPVSGWTTALEVPAEHVDGAGQQTMSLAALGLLTALGCATLAGLIFGRRIEHALTETARSAKALGEGMAVPRVATAVNEVDQLNETLTAAAALLEQVRAEREQLLSEAQTGRDRAEIQARAKEQFLATLGHELRNPLAPISTAAHILKLPGLNENRLEQTRGIIERQVAHLTRLVDELIDVSRVTRGVLVLQNDALDLNSILAEAVEQVQDIMEERRHELVVHPSSKPAWVNADGSRMTQVLMNLLHNAAKFTPDAGHIVLTVEVSEESVVITVKDNGNGIAADFLPHVFDLFAQSNRISDHSQGGLGLGLSLVKGLVELHDGAVSVHSAGEGRGSEFRVELPRLVHATGPEANGNMPGTIPNVMSVMPVLNVVVVDDNVDAAESLAMYLKASFGYRVWVYADAQSALTCADHDAPDAFVLDIGLPGIDGYELARRLRSNPLTAHALLIAVTGYGQQRDRERAFEAGFDHHLTKPADPVELSNLLMQTMTE